MLKIFNDSQNFQGLFLDTDDFLDLLDPHIGERNAMQLGILDIRVKDFWEPLEICVFQNEGTVDIPDISIWKAGLILMNEKSYQAIKNLLEPHGEFLSCNMLGGKGYLFHCLNIYEFKDTEAEYQMQGNIFAEITSLKFDSSAEDSIVTGINKVSFDQFCNRKLADKLNENNIKGALFSKELSDPLPVEK